MKIESWNPTRQRERWPRPFAIAAVAAIATGVFGVSRGFATPPPSASVAASAQPLRAQDRGVQVNTAQVNIGPSQAAVLTWTRLRGGLSPRPSLDWPYAVQVKTGRHLDPFWGPDGLWSRRLRAPRPGDVATGAARGAAVWDPSSQSFFAMFAGLLIRVDRSARGESWSPLLPGVAGHDLDVRALAGVAVSREPDDTIVLHRFAGGIPSRRILLRGPGYFEPQLSPDGTKVLVSQSRAGGGHMIVVDLNEAAGRPAVHDLGQGYGPTWHPAGDRVVFAVIQQREGRISSSELWMQWLRSGRRLALSSTVSTAEIEPAISPDGHFVSYVNAQTGRLLLAALPSIAGPATAGQGGTR